MKVLEEKNGEYLLLLFAMIVVVRAACVRSFFCAGYAIDSTRGMMMYKMQVGLKVSGFSSRIAALETILYMIIDRIRGLPKPADKDDRKAAGQVCYKKTNKIRPQSAFRQLQ